MRAKLSRFGDEEIDWVFAITEVSDYAVIGHVRTRSWVQGESGIYAGWAWHPYGGFGAWAVHLHGHVPDEVMASIEKVCVAVYDATKLRLELVQEETPAWEPDARAVD